MIMTNAITEAGSIAEVVKIINASRKGESSGYFGGTDTRDAGAMAGQYAWESAVESGYTDAASIEAQLDFLVERGAEFDFAAALENAIRLKKIQDLLPEPSLNLETEVQSYNTLSSDSTVCVQSAECIQYVRGVLNNGK